MMLISGAILIVYMEDTLAKEDRGDWMESIKHKFMMGLLVTPLTDAVLGVFIGGKASSIVKFSLMMVAYGLSVKTRGVRETI